MNKPQLNGHIQMVVILGIDVFSDILKFGQKERAYSQSSPRLQIQDL